MHIFLDIDGVFRSNTTPPDEFEPHCLRAFEEVVMDFPELRLEISSPWRIAIPLPEIRNRFSWPVGRKVVGKTPMLDYRNAYIRYQEILTYLKAHYGRKRVANSVASRLLKAWVAIDDDPNLFPASTLGEHLLLTDGSVGFDARCAGELPRMLGKSRNDGDTPPGSTRPGGMAGCQLIWCVPGVIRREFDGGDDDCV